MNTYLVIPKDSDPFFTNYYTAENCHADGMAVINIITRQFSRDGIEWKPIEEDHL